MSLDKDEKNLTLGDLQSCMRDMLYQFDAFCTQNHLRYYLCYGTLIGAIRHGGFIPWDDDADIVMPRKDYEKLLAHSRVNDNIIIISNRNTQGCTHPFCYANLVDQRTTMSSSFLGDKSGKGVFIDVFPIDPLPEKRFSRRMLLTRMKWLDILLWYSVLPDSTFERKTIKGKIRALIAMYAKKLNVQRIQDKIENACKKNKGEKHLSMYAHFVSHIWGFDYGDISSFEPSRRILFEGIELPIPAKSEKLLEGIYGDYMTPPPVEKQQGHHKTNFYWK